jgi:sugar phosphate isomerase/epimerase
LAVPLGIRIGYEALSWGLHVNEYPLSWEIIEMADHSNLGLVLDSFHILSNNTSLETIADIPGEKIALVQLSDYMWRDIHTPQERLETARHLRVFPGEGTHSHELSDILRRVDRCGYRGDYSFEVFNDDYLQMPPEVVAIRAHKSAKWVTDQVLRRSLQARELHGVQTTQG